MNILDFSLPGDLPPQQAAELNQEFSKRLAFALNPLSGNTNLVDRVSSDPLLSGVSLSGDAYDFSGSQANEAFSWGVNTYDPFYLSEGLTIVLTVFRRSTSDTKYFGQWGLPPYGWVVASDSSGRPYIAIGYASQIEAYRADISLAANTRTTVVFRWDGTNGAGGYKFWIDGRKSGTSASVVDNGNPTYVDNLTSSPFQIGRDTTGGALNGKIFSLSGFFGGLTDSECSRLSLNPYEIFRQKKRRVWVPGGGGESAQDLSGNATAQAAAAAALTHSVPLAGAGLSVATATGGLSVSIPLAAAAQSQAAASATLTTSGSAALAGNATAQANATGGLGLTVPLSGAAVAQALAQAGLAHGVPLAGAASGQAAAGGALTLNISLSGAAISQAAASAGLTVLGASDLAGNATAHASASAALSHGVPLSGASVVVSNASGSLSQILPVAGSAASASMATGGLDVAVRLQADALVQALAAAGLDVQGGLSGAAAAVAGAGATLTLRINLAGDAVASAIAAGALSTAGLIVSSTPGYVVSRNPRDYRVERTPRTWRISA